MNAERSERNEWWGCLLVWLLFAAVVWLAVRSAS